MDKLAVLTIGLLIGLMLVFIPFSLVWAINVLLGQHNPYSFWTWLAAVVVITLFRMPNADKNYLKKSRAAR